MLKRLLEGFVVVVLLVGGTSACTIINGPRQSPAPKTQLEVREFQTREFDTNDTKLVLKAVLNVLQDDGFVVKNAVIDLGLLTATKELQLSGGTRSSNTANNNNSDAWEEIFNQIFRTKGRAQSQRNTTTADSRYNKFKVIEVSINVSEIGKRSRVRANFLAKILDNNGVQAEVYTIDDMKFYQDFFAKVDKGIFLQRQGL